MARRYYMLVPSAQWKAMIQNLELQPLCNLILERTINDPDKYQSGLTKIFFRAGMLAALESLRSGRLNALVTIVQKNMRRRMAVKKYQELLWNAGSPQDFSGAFEVNVAAVWYTAVCFLDLLDAGNKRGNTPGVTSQILTVSSGGAFRKDDKVFSVPYTLSKSAATHLGKMLAHFLKDWQIRSNIIAPGIFPSGMAPSS